MSRVNEVGKKFRGMKSVVGCKSLSLDVKRRLSTQLK